MLLRNGNGSWMKEGKMSVTKGIVSQQLYERNNAKQKTNVNSSVEWIRSIVSGMKESIGVWWYTKGSSSPINFRRYTFKCRYSRMPWSMIALQSSTTWSEREEKFEKKTHKIWMVCRTQLQSRKCTVGCCRRVKKTMVSGKKYFTHVSARETLGCTPKPCAWTSVDTECLSLSVSHSLHRVPSEFFFGLLYFLVVTG